MEPDPEQKPEVTDPTLIAKVWWWEAQVESESCYAREEPADPAPGQMWYDPVEHIHYVWDGFQWEEMPED